MPGTSKEAAMETEASAPTLEEADVVEVARKSIKRKLVSVFNPNEEVVENKRRNIPIDEAMKYSCLYALQSFLKIVTIEAASKETKSADQLYLDLTYGIKLSSALFTIAKVSKLTSQGKGEALSQKANKGFQLTTKYTLSLEAGLRHFNTACTAAKINPSIVDSKSPECIWGTLLPYVSFFSGFGLRIKELRVGHGKMPISNEKEISVSDYGIGGRHHIMLEGCTYPPEKRAAMAQSLGPLTSLILMMRTPSGYNEKWKAATERSFAHIPNIRQIIHHLVQPDAEKRTTGMISALADLALVLGTRAQTRIFFPINALEFLPMEMKEDNLTCAVLVDVSGLKAFNWYKYLLNKKFTLNCHFQPDAARQVVFHAIFGTFKEDLGILKCITGVDFLRRKDLGTGFRDTQSAGAVVCEMIPFLYFSKMAGANQTKLISTGTQQIISANAFSGKRNVILSEEFFLEMRSRLEVTGVASRSVSELITDLRDLTRKLIDKLQAGGRSVETGTTEWYKCNQDNELAPSDFKPVTSGVFYLSS